ncbi:PREDICTED: uncharacterized protein LOC104800981 [Tarenaya hassleriana]|uniref:uncharacterized protein LOC104800981 n=1 Tax=Tarenaya hassleriana TaxID=28532 RepID=UPI00053C4400|nr:PREDICTED: uncharacterized protein LOC104800981 [Tarenaya hassleriana]XP_010522336.1 PREDICTED: uncharacterized protein LOC104800981 [Tarenaya hassleriana]
MTSDPTVPPPPTYSNSAAIQLSENPPLLPLLPSSDNLAAALASPSLTMVPSLSLCCLLTFAEQDARVFPFQTELRSNNGVADRLPDEIPNLPHFDVLDGKEYAEKYRKYESEYTQMLLAKYFSGKNIYGGNIFEEKTMIGGETIMSSRWPCTRSYAQPTQFFHEQNNKGSAFSEKNPSEISNGFVQSGKNC